MMNIGKRIKERRREIHMSQTILSEKSGVNRTTISQLESGVRNNILINKLCAIASALDVSVEFFLKSE